MVCRNGKLAGHNANKICDLCGSGEHFARSCRHWGKESYAEKIVEQRFWDKGEEKRERRKKQGKSQNVNVSHEDGGLWCMFPTLKNS